MGDIFGFLRRGKSLCRARRKARWGLPSLPPIPIATKTGLRRATPSDSVLVVGIPSALERLGLAEGKLLVVVDTLGGGVLGLPSRDVFVLAVAVEDIRVGELVTLGAARGVEDDRRGRLRGRVLLVRAALRAVDGRLPEVVELRSAPEARMFESEVRQCASCLTGPEHNILGFSGSTHRMTVHWGADGGDPRASPEFRPRRLRGGSSSRRRRACADAVRPL